MDQYDIVNFINPSVNISFVYNLPLFPPTVSLSLSLSLEFTLYFHDLDLSTIPSYYSILLFHPTIPGDLTSIPSAPRDLTAVALNSTHVRLSWSIPRYNNEDIISYTVHYTNMKLHTKGWLLGIIHVHMKAHVALSHYMYSSCCY